LTIEVLLFASARDLAGKNRLRLSMIEGSKAEDVWSAPELAALRPRIPGVRLALNERFSDGDEALKEGDVLAVLPPVSGG
jgi:molybdopterin converting factor small subunit